MKLSLMFTSVIILIFNLMTVELNAQAPLYGVSPFIDSLYAVDTTTITEISSMTLGLTSNTGVVIGANGMDSDPSDPCGMTYIVYQSGSSRYLGTIDLATAVITEIGVLSDNIANITFDDNGVLYGVTGDGASVSETLYTIDKTNATMTFAATLGNGDDGEAIEFCSDNGLIYHWSGWGVGDVIMETVDPITFAITPIAISHPTLANVGSATYAGNGQFIISDINSDGLYRIDTSGTATLLSTTFAAQFKGLDFNPILTAQVSSTSLNDSICSGDTVVLTCTNTGVTYDWILDGVSTGVTTASYNATVSGAYVCEITSVSCPTAVSDTIHIVVSNSPTVNLTPSSATLCTAGDSVQLSLNTGGGAATFQWYLNGSMIGGATNSDYFAVTAGLYNATKTNIAGCTDSSSTAVMVMNNITTSTISDAACFSYTVPSGNATYTTSGTYSDTIPNMMGCDSIITINLTIHNTPTVTITPSSAALCTAGDSVQLSANTGGGAATFQWYLNGSMIGGATNSDYFVTMAGTYNVIKTNTAGCSDSASTSVMVMNNITMSTISDAACFSYTVPSGNATYTTSGTYSDTISNMMGCDSIITINLTIYGVDVATTLSATGDTVTANETGASYQWLDCNNGNAPIVGATNQWYAATANGDYAVEITTANNCVDTSACVSVVVVGVTQLKTTEQVTVLPNPNTGRFALEFSQLPTSTTVEIYSSTGQKVYQRKINTAVHNVELNVSSGMYFIRISNVNSVRTLPVIIQ